MSNQLMIRKLVKSAQAARNKAMRKNREGRCLGGCLKTGNLLAILIVFLMFFLQSVELQAATVTILNQDGFEEGFNDPTPVAAVPGNPGTTLGAQRLIAAQAAADAWGAVLSSPVTIVVGMNFDPMDCSSSEGILGRAGPNWVYSDFPGAPRAATWYPDALADSLAGTNLGEPTDTDISATFNSDIDFNDSCLTGIDWWYGIGSPAIPGTVDFTQTLLHEIAHGLGFFSLVDLDTGAQLLDIDGIYEVFLEDHSTGKTWASMSNAERLASSVDTGDLHWVGPNVVANSGVLSSGVGASNHVQMYAPNPVDSGGSVSHWDTNLSPDELMEPFATSDGRDLVSYQLFRDIGWTVSGPVDVIGLGLIGAPSSISVPGSDTDGSYIISWGSSRTSSVTYVLQESANSIFSDATTVYSGTSTSKAISGKSNGTYYYRVKATKGGYTDSEWRIGSNGVTVSLLADADGDGVDGSIDSCPTGESGWISNPTTDHDGDGCKDATEDTDDDNDGLPDSYEEQYGFNPLNASDAAADKDGDGYTNLEEYLAGTNPNDADDLPIHRSVILKILPYIIRP